MTWRWGLGIKCRFISFHLNINNEAGQWVGPSMWCALNETERGNEHAWCRQNIWRFSASLCVKQPHVRTARGNVQIPASWTVLLSSVLDSGAWLNRINGGASRCPVEQLSWRLSRESWTCSWFHWGDLAWLGDTFTLELLKWFNSRSAHGPHWQREVRDVHQVLSRRRHAPHGDHTPRDKSQQQQQQQRVNFTGGDMRLCNRGAMMLLTTAGAFCAFSLMTIAVGTDYWLYSRGMCRSKSQNDNETVRKNEEVLTHSGLWRTCCTEGRTRKEHWQSPTKSRGRSPAQPNDAIVWSINKKKKVTYWMFYELWSIKGCDEGKFNYPTVQLKIKIMVILERHGHNGICVPYSKFNRIERFKCKKEELGKKHLHKI